MLLLQSPNPNPNPNPIQSNPSAITTAYDCLSDKQRRKIYDERGIDTQQPMGDEAFATHRQAYAYTQDLTPEDLFDMFFNGLICL